MSPKRTLDDVRLQARDRDAIREASALLRREFPVEDVILFGSKARGDDDEESDIDLLVLTSRALSFDERRAVYDALYPVQVTHDVVLSAVIIPVDEWDHGVVSALPIHDEVATHGIGA